MNDKVKILDEGYVRLVEPWGSDERIVESARMSTGRSFISWEPYKRCRDCECNDTKLVPEYCKGGPEGGRTEHNWTVVTKGDSGLLQTLWKNKHTTPFEMCGATFEIQAPIMVFREWHRHRTQSYSEMSARYAPLPDVNYTPTVERLMMSSSTNKQAQAVAGSQDLTEKAARDWLEELSACYEDCEAVYRRGLNIGVPKELARLIVPVGRYSRMRASANLLNWLRFLTLRMPENAQWEIRQYAGAVCEELSTQFPKTMALFGEELVCR